MDWVRRNLHPWYTENKQVGGLILFTEVITRRKQAEIALKENEERYRIFFEKGTDGIVVNDYHQETTSSKSKIRSTSSS